MRFGRLKDVASLLEQNSYGKSGIRLTKVVRTPQRHELFEMSVDIRLEGDFAASYERGDNRKIIATDSMKNTVYVLAKENEFDSIESFAMLLSKHFASTYPQVATANVDISQTKWDRIAPEGEPHPHAFVAGGCELRTVSVSKSKDKLTVTGGIANLQVLKTTDSEFTEFVTDRYRTLKDAKDRIFATAVDADWTYKGPGDDFDVAFAAIRATLLTTFATHHSLAVQQTLLKMGEAALDVCASIDRIELKMPNQHRIPFDLRPFGLENNNEIFVPTDEPFGMITGVVTRK
jgi:urate oxidase